MISGTEETHLAGWQMGLKRRLDHFLPQVRFGQVNIFERGFLISCNISRPSSCE